MLPCVCLHSSKRVWGKTFTWYSSYLSCMPSFPFLSTTTHVLLLLLSVPLCFYIETAWAMCAQLNTGVGSMYTLTSLNLTHGASIWFVSFFYIEAKDFLFTWFRYMHTGLFVCDYLFVSTANNAGDWLRRRPSWSCDDWVAFELQLYHPQWLYIILQDILYLNSLFCVRLLCSATGFSTTFL